MEDASQLIMEQIKAVVKPFKYHTYNEETTLNINNAVEAVLFAAIDNEWIEDDFNLDTNVVDETKQATTRAEFKAKGREFTDSVNITLTCQ